MLYREPLSPTASYPRPPAALAGTAVGTTPAMAVVVTAAAVSRRLVEGPVRPLTALVREGRRVTLCAPVCSWCQDRPEQSSPRCTFSSALVTARVSTQRRHSHPSG